MDRNTWAGIFFLISVLFIVGGIIWIIIKQVRKDKEENPEKTLKDCTISFFKELGDAGYEEEEDEKEVEEETF